MLTVCIVVMVIFLFLRNILGHPDSRLRRAVLHRGHVRRDVPAGLQPEQPLADGADAFGGLRGGRRHRDAGEHRAPHGNGRDAHAGGAGGLEGNRLHHSLHDHLAGGGLHPGALHGGHRGTPAARVLGDHRGGDSDLRVRLADADAHAGQPLPARRAQPAPRHLLPRPGRRIQPADLVVRDDAAPGPALPPGDLPGRAWPCWWEPCTCSRPCRRVSFPARTADSCSASCWDRRTRRTTTWSTTRRPSGTS